MNKFMDWLGNSFAPKMQKITQRPWIAALSSAMQKIIPFILTGSIVFLYNVFRSYITVLPDIGLLADYTFGMLGILTAFMMTNQAMEKLKHPRYTVVASLVSVIVFLIFTNPSVSEEGIFSLEMSRMGPTGILVGIISGIFVSIIFNLFGKLNFLKDSEIPDFVVEWINNIIPISLTIGLSTFIVFKLNFDVFDAIIKLFSPLQLFGQTLPGFILLCFLPAFFYSIGISTWLWGAISTPIYMTGIMENIDAVAKGLPATNISTSETVFTAALITMGGVGATLALNVLMLRSKSAKMKTIGRICIVPSIFNINEPVMFSTPVVMNPLLMLPMWINGIVGPIIVWTVMRLGLMNIPSKMIQVGQIPAPISSFIITEDWRSIIVYILLFAVYTIVWYPFFKVFEKQLINEEN